MLLHRPPACDFSAFVDGHWQAGAPPLERPGIDAQRWRDGDRALAHRSKQAAALAADLARHDLKAAYAGFGVREEWL